MPEAARQGTFPTVPDFSAETHKRWRPKLATLTELVAARDLEGLRNFVIKPISTSPKALARYRDAAVAAIEATPRAGMPPRGRRSRGGWHSRLAGVTAPAFFLRFLARAIYFSYSAYTL